MLFRRQSKIWGTLFLCTLAFGSLGSTCSGKPSSLANAPCDPNVVAVAMWDSQLQQICGCGGTNGSFVSKGNPLDCTFSAGSSGKTVFVYYEGPFLQHQIIPVGTPAIPTGSIFDPSASNPIRVTTFTLTTPGTYEFRDEYDPSITGTFTVHP